MKGKPRTTHFLPLSDAALTVDVKAAKADQNNVAEEIAY
jgi:hypothetical protein